MGEEQPHVIAVIGAGPRGTSFLERLLAQVEEIETSAEHLHIHVIDPAPHGPGKVWDPDQPSYYLMNTPAEFPTAAPVGGTNATLASSSCSTSFLDWSQQHQAGYQPGDYPRRTDYGRYLLWLYQAVIAGLRDRGARIDEHYAQAVDLSPTASGYALTLDTGQKLAPDQVVLALGHIPAQLDPTRSSLAEAAGQHGLHYQPPAIPTEANLEAIGAGESVLVRGMGLNFFDAMIHLTAGRGGQFQPSRENTPGQRLNYLPSRREPQIIAGARRGVPYRAKSTVQGFVPAQVQLTHTIDAALTSRLTGQDQLGDVQALWGMIAADVEEHYRRHGGRGDFSLDAYGYPFRGETFATGSQYQQVVCDYLAQDAAHSYAAAQNPEKMAVAAFHAARLQIKTWIAAGQIAEPLRVQEIEGSIEPLVEGLASGPPVQRIEELAALARAGLVTFLGPAPRFAVDETAGTFMATSPAVASTTYHARYLVDAMMPANRVALADAPLVQGLLSRNLARSAQLAGAKHKGFEVTGRPHQLITVDNEPLSGVYVLGLQLSSAQWGTAIAAEAGGDPQGTANTLADAHAVAQAVLTATKTPAPQP